MQSEISFFLVRTEVWQIGDSQPAVKFNVVVEPNDWAKINTNSSTYSRELTETRLNKLEFWNEFKDFGQNSNTSLKINRKARPQHWYDISFGSSKAHLVCTNNLRDRNIGMEVYIKDDKKLYHKLYEKRAEFEHDFLSEDIRWDELPEKKASRVRLFKECDPENKENYQEYFEWLIKNGEKLVKAFNKFA